MNKSRIKKIGEKIKEKFYIFKKVGEFYIKMSQWTYSPKFLKKCIGRALVVPAHFFLTDDFYKFLIYTKIKNNGLPYKKLTRFSVDETIIRMLTGDKSFTAELYANYLSKNCFRPEIQNEWARRCIEVGRLDLAYLGYLNVVKREQDKLPSDQLINVYRSLGAVCFMLGKNNEALDHWRMAGRLKKAMRRPDTPSGYRILGHAWFAAIGHVAMLDYYLKFHRLYTKEQPRIVADCDAKHNPANELMIKFKKLGIEVVSSDSIPADYNRWARRNRVRCWDELTNYEKAALVDDFWEYEFPNGEILGYAHAASRIQRDWEESGQAPLLILDEADQQWVSMYLENLGIPKGAWYVCLHVRESGFHKQWNSVYPSMRDAEIESYFSAIERIVDAGGWVLRMGDESMKPLTPMKNVIDYAHSPFKTQTADVLLAAGCKFFLGTNSGYATIPAIYNIPCLLTNWIPVGWPLWPSTDLMITKLFKDRHTGKVLTMNDVFERKLAFIQNWSDLPPDLELVPNSPEELKVAVDEMIRLHVFGDEAIRDKLCEYNAAQQRYEDIATTHGAFTGSRIASTFLDKHAASFQLI